MKNQSRVAPASPSLSSSPQQQLPRMSKKYGSSKIFSLSDINPNFERDQTKKWKKFVYDPDKLPPNFGIAKEHALAMRVGKEKLEKIKHQILNVCLCCSRKIDRTPFPLCGKDVDLAYIGSGYPLYFSFLKFCGRILTILLLSSGGFNLVTNYLYGNTCTSKKSTTTTTTTTTTTSTSSTTSTSTGSKMLRFLADAQNNDCERNWITIFSIGNKTGQSNLIVWQDILNFCSIMLMIVLFQIFRKSSKQLDQDCDTADISACDYTVLMKNIPSEYDALNNDYDDDIKYWVEEVLMKDQGVKVVNVNLTYKMAKLSEYTEQRKEIMREKKKEIMHFYKHKQYKNHTPQQLDQKAQEIQEKVDNLTQHFLDGKGKTFMKQFFTGWAFITVETEEAKDKILAAMERPGVFQKKKKIMYQGKQVQIEVAPDPTNVFWENLHISNHLIRELRSYFFVALWTVLCFFIVYGIMIWQKTVSEKYAQDSSLPLDFKKHLYVQGTALFLSLIITLLSYVSYFIIRKIVSYERQWTRTIFNISAIKLLSFTQFVISALLTFFVEIFVIQTDGVNNFNKIFGSGGLVYNQNFVFILNSVVPFVTELIDFEAQFKKLIRRKLYQNVDQGIPILYTQSELNELFEDPQFDIIGRYADCLKTMYLCAFYSPILPFGLFWSLLAILLHFWVDKYNLLRRKVIKYNMSSDLSIEMTEMLEFVLIIYCFGNLIFWIFILGDKDNISGWSLIGAIVGIIHAGLPMDTINSKICKVKDAPPNEQPLQEVELQFLTDYARENPATQNEANAAFLAKVQGMRDIQNEQIKQDYKAKQFQIYQTRRSQFQPNNESELFQMQQSNILNTEVSSARQQLLNNNNTNREMPGAQYITFLPPLSNKNSKARLSDKQFKIIDTNNQEDFYDNLGEAEEQGFDFKQNRGSVMRLAQAEEKFKENRKNSSQLIGLKRTKDSEYKFVKQSYE